MPVLFVVAWNVLMKPTLLVVSWLFFRLTVAPLGSMLTVLALLIGVGIVGLSFLSTCCTALCPTSV